MCDLDLDIPLTPAEALALADYIDATPKEYQGDWKTQMCSRDIFGEPVP